MKGNNHRCDFASFFFFFIFGCGIFIFLASGGNFPFYKAQAGLWEFLRRDTDFSFNVEPKYLEVYPSSSFYLKIKAENKNPSWAFSRSSLFFWPEDLPSQIKVDYQNGSCFLPCEKELKFSTGEGIKPGHYQITIKGKLGGNEKSGIFILRIKCRDCADGTFCNQCSRELPLFCQEGKLINRCDLCGCPVNHSCQKEGGCEKNFETFYFKFKIPPVPETFVFELTDPEKIKKARNILEGKEKKAVHIMGKIVKKEAEYNKPWHYHLDPSSINFFESASEICNFSIKYIEQNLAKACDSFLHNCFWCPKNSILVEEIKF